MYNGEKRRWSLNTCRSYVVLVISEVARVRVCAVHWFRSTNCLQTQFLSSAVSTYQDQDHRRIIATVKNIYNVNVLSV